VSRDVLARLRALLREQGGLIASLFDHSLPAGAPEALAAMRTCVEPSAGSPPIGPRYC